MNKPLASNVAPSATADVPLAELATAAVEAATLLKALAIADRLLLLCTLVESERNVSVLETLTVLPFGQGAACEAAPFNPTGASSVNIDYANFTPWASLAGGLAIGLSVSVYALGIGRIAGISGIAGTALNGLASGSLRGQFDRLVFLLCLVAAPLLWTRFHALPPMTPVAGTGTLLVAGLLVGVGVRMGNGCTSGHGVCGLSRFSPRSLANVLAFMGAGVVAVYVVKHLL